MNKLKLKSSKANQNKVTQTKAIKRSPIKSLLLIPLITLLPACEFLGKIDYSNLLTREGYNHSSKVIAHLDIKAGSQIVDLGAGDGYFSFMLAEATGPKGHVYAVDIDPDKIDQLKQVIKEKGLNNITVVTGSLTDPKLPSKSIDLVFLSNAYHHLENRIEYLKQLHVYLNPKAKVAVLDTKHGRISMAVVPKGHWLDEGQIHQEFIAADYHLLNSYDYLPVNTFDIFQRDLMAAKNN